MTHHLWPTARTFHRVDEAAARGDEHGRQYWERCVADHTAMLRRWQAEERVA